jgi:uncharacterized protein (DUF1810 family)
MDDPYHLQRFVDAQNPIYANVCEELRRGSKSGHWMWFIFPQISGLGLSEMSKRFAISSLNEAKAFLLHPILGERLQECTRLVNQINERSIHEIFGHPDDLKFWSCMSLFAKATDNNAVFVDALEKYFDGKYDEATLQLIRS